MNDLQLWPENYPKEYDPKILEAGDLIQYYSFNTEGVIYEVVDFNVPMRDDEFGLNIRETCRPREIISVIDPGVFSFHETASRFHKVFALKIKNKDKILKSNLCKVIAAKFFMEKELNELLIEMDI